MDNKFKVREIMDTDDDYTDDAGVSDRDLQFFPPDFFFMSCHGRKFSVGGVSSTEYDWLIVFQPASL